jgi:hypothetical protein
MKALLYDFRWTDEHSCELQGIVDGRFGRKPLVIEENISIEVCSTSRCAGFTENGKWKVCPKHSEGKAKCEYCRAIEGNFVYTAFDGFNQAQLQPGGLEKISGEHVVYLALFDTDVIKIGVSNLGRKSLRQIEQGSHQTLYIAQTPDGVVARQIETLFRRSGLADKVMGRQKKSLLLPDVSAEEGENILHALFSNHISALDSAIHLKKFLLENPEFKNWPEVYKTENIFSLGKPLHPISLKQGEWVSGKILAIKGSFIIIDTEEELVSLNLKSLSGRECDLSVKQGGLQLNKALQNSLF